MAHAGTAAEVRALAGQAPGAQTIDLKEGCAVPGLTDSHIHLLSYGLNLSRVPLSGLTSREAALERIGAAARAALGTKAGACV